MSEDNYEEGYDEFIAEIYEEHRKEFKSERLQSYYINNKLLAKPAIDALSEARNLAASNVTGGFIFASIAMEVGLKTTLLKPIVYGLVNAESVAALVTELAISRRTSMGNYKNLLLHVLQEHGGVNLDNFTRSGTNKTLWEEIEIVQKIRNKIMHRAEVASKGDVDLALGVASEILEVTFPAVIKKMGLHLHDGCRICDDSMCKYKEMSGFQGL